MRDELSDLLGQPVVLAGRLNRCEPNAIGSLNVCLKAVDVYPWRTDVAISALTPVRIDHGWLQMSNLEHALGGPVEMYWMTAEVTNYQRRNGSRDIGFRHRPSLCIDHLLNTILGTPTNSQQHAAIVNALNRIQNSNHLFGFHYNPVHIQEMLQIAAKKSSATDQDSLKTFLQAQVAAIKQFAKTDEGKRNHSSTALGFHADA